MGVLVGFGLRKGRARVTVQWPHGGTGHPDGAPVQQVGTSDAVEHE
ncbi:hypothetical protein G7009_26730 [Pseudomonas capeferrum]|nr:hypothetical protein [Pseudomonas capeferrum]MBA1205308.1 hypothetical protein [Pseudomonas capeferrum]